MVIRVFNNEGADITGTDPELLYPTFGFIDKRGKIQVNWGLEDDLCDGNGFDKTFRPVVGSDAYVIHDYVLPQGMIISRYGYPSGKFTTVKGTPYSTLSLPYKEKTVEYHEYIVIGNITVKCIVTKGRVAAKFGSLGGAIQYMHERAIIDEIKIGNLKEVELWT